MALIILSNNGAWDSTALGIIATAKTQDQFEKYVNFRFPSSPVQTIYADTLPNFKQVLADWMEEYSISELMYMGQATTAMLVTSTVTSDISRYWLYIAVDLTT